MDQSLADAGQCTAPRSRTVRILSKWPTGNCVHNDKLPEPRRGCQRFTAVSETQAAGPREHTQPCALPSKPAGRAAQSAHGTTAVGVQSMWCWVQRCWFRVTQSHGSVTLSLTFSSKTRLDLALAAAVAHSLAGAAQPQLRHRLPTKVARRAAGGTRRACRVADRQRCRNAWINSTPAVATNLPYAPARQQEAWPG